MCTKYQLLPPVTSPCHQISQSSILFLSKRINRSVAPPHVNSKGSLSILCKHVVPRPASGLETCFPRLCLEPDENITIVLTKQWHSPRPWLQTCTNAPRFCLNSTSHTISYCHHICFKPPIHAYSHIQFSF